jgi:hypothetical protein
MKKLILTAALVATVASPALAATHHLRNNAAMQGAYTAEDAYAFARPDADSVVADGKVIGRDPDAFIRESLIREGDHGNQNGY